jgi:hypothetical protein
MFSTFSIASSFSWRVLNYVQLALAKIYSYLAKANKYKLLCTPPAKAGGNSDKTIFLLQLQLAPTIPISAMVLLPI